MDGDGEDDAVGDETVHPDEPADAGAARLLAAMLSIGPDRARAIRAGTARVRRRPQSGPSADYGD